MPKIDNNIFPSVRHERVCPVCDKAANVLFLEENISLQKISDYTYASRKSPEYMTLRMVRCLGCDTVYAPIPPEANFLAEVYTNAAYDSNEEATYAARIYMKTMLPFIKDLPSLGGAVDVGAGNGALLPLFQNIGFSHVLGVEPSRSALKAAPVEIQPYLHEGVFTAETLSGFSPSLICSFMTLEHILNPAEFIQSAYDSLVSNGKIAVVVHNWQGLLNKFLGKKSPIIDIEHLQLYCPNSIQNLLAKSGFKNIQITSFSNVYPMRYWLRLAPLPHAIKKALLTGAKLMKIDKCKVAVNVGNIMAIAEK